VRLPGTLYLIDTSAAARMTTNPPVRTLIESLMDSGLAATSVTMDLEAGFSVRQPRDVSKVLAIRADRLVTLPVTESAAQRAREVQVLMATRGLHRAAGPIDLLTAAIAELHRAIVLHYDADFDHIASVTGQRHDWIAPRGSID
jgi:predicted nucleic acid-binding protein